jgi:P27 family predicted phage terminase small subunit
MAGRRPKPKGSLVLDSVPEGAPEKPEGLSAVASAAWDALVGDLTELGIISEVDRAAIEMAARYTGHYAEAAADVKANGLTIPTKQGAKANPSIRARDDAARILKSYLVELGLTPAARSKVQHAAQPSSDVPSLEDILDGDGTPGSAGGVA